MHNITTQTPAIDKAARIFRFIVQNNGATYSQIYQGLNLPQSSTSTLLASLITHGFLRQHEGKYHLGMLLYEFGNIAIEQFDLKTLAMQPLNHLRDKTHLACHLGILEGQSTIYLARLESPGAISIRSWLGKRLSLHSSSLGKVLLAWLSDEQIDQLLPNETLEAKTQKTITSKSALKKELQLVKQIGWASDFGEDYDDINCIAAPVFDRNQQVVAAISTSGVSFQLTEENKERFAEYVCQAAKELSLLIR